MPLPGTVVERKSAKAWFCPWGASRTVQQCIKKQTLIKHRLKVSGRQDEVNGDWHRIKSSEWYQPSEMLRWELTPLEVQEESPKRT